MYVRTIQHLTTVEKNLSFFFFNVVYHSDTPVTLKQCQGHLIWYKLVDPKDGYSKAKFEKPRLNNVPERANDKVFVKSGNMSIISL